VVLTTPTPPRTATRSRPHHPQSPIHTHAPPLSRSPLLPSPAYSDDLPKHPHPHLPPMPSRPPFPLFLTHRQGAPAPVCHLPRRRNVDSRRSEHDAT
ncbi:hypothetical protein STRIP9103_02939, partial [Streptomyces ipomoeae 91-03]